MTVRALIDILQARVLAGEAHLDKDVADGYCCDLLSWVMAHGKRAGAWITVQTHLNTIAVASLLELSCIIIPEDIEVNTQTLAKAEEEGIAVLGTALTGYQVSGRMAAQGVGD
jgi:hypothetical protein